MTEASDDGPSVDRCTVVIPTSGRLSVVDAVASALSQRDVELEVIIAPTHELPHETVHSLRRIRSGVRVLPISEGPANRARQAGIQAASYPLVALLDDDDYWLPGKLANQLWAARAVGIDPECDSFIVSSSLLILEDRRKASLWQQSEGVLAPPQEYLFRSHERLRSARHQLQTSTLLFPTRLALEHPLPADLRVHQDWGWLLGLEERYGNRLTVIGCSSAVVIYNRNSETRSVSSATRADESADWARQYLLRKDRDSERAYGRFLVRVSSRFAARNGDLRATTRVVLMGIKHGRLGLWDWIAASRQIGIAAWRKLGRGLRWVAGK